MFNTFHRFCWNVTMDERRPNSEVYNSMKKYFNHWPDLTCSGSSLWKLIYGLGCIIQYRCTPISNQIPINLTSTGPQIYVSFTVLYYLYSSLQPLKIFFVPYSHPTSNDVPAKYMFNVLRWMKFNLPEAPRTGNCLACSKRILGLNPYQSKLVNIINFLYIWKAWFFKRTSYSIAHARNVAQGDYLPKCEHKPYKHYLNIAPRLKGNSSLKCK